MNKYPQLGSGSVLGILARKPEAFRETRYERNWERKLVAFLDTRFDGNLARMLEAFLKTGYDRNAELGKRHYSFNINFTLTVTFLDLSILGSVISILVKTWVKE